MIVRFSNERAKVTLGLWDKNFRSQYCAVAVIDSARAMEQLTWMTGSAARYREFVTTFLVQYFPGIERYSASSSSSFLPYICVSWYNSQKKIQRHVLIPSHPGTNMNIKGSINLPTTEASILKGLYESLIVAASCTALSSTAPVHTRILDSWYKFGNIPKYQN